MFLLLDCTGSTTQSSDTTQEDVIELLAKLGGLKPRHIHIMTGSVYEQRNMQSCKARGKKAFEDCYKRRQNSSLYLLSPCVGKMSHT